MSVSASERGAAATSFTSKARGVSKSIFVTQGSCGSFFYPATVLSNVSNDAKMLNEEIFGPVASLQTFKSEDGVVGALTTLNTASWPISTPRI